MAIQFPNNPSVGDTITQAGINYLWNGVSWEVVPEIIEFSDIANIPTTLAGYGIIDADVKGDLGVTGQSTFIEDVNISGDLYVTGKAYISPDSIHMGGSRISDHPTSGIVIDGSGLAVNGELYVGGENIYDAVQDALTFDHDETLFPSGVKTYDEALEYSTSQNHLDDVLTGHFFSGLNGFNFSESFKLTVTSRQGGFASSTDPSSIYLLNDVANITANPLPGYSFDYWSGANYSDINDQFVNTTTVPMNKDQYVTAYFKKN